MLYDVRGRGFKSRIPLAPLGNCADSIAQVEHGVSAVGAPPQNLDKFVYPALPTSSGRYINSRWSLQSGAYTRGSKIKYPTKGVHV